MPVAKRGGALQPRDANTVHDNPALAHFYRKRELSALTDTCGTLYTRPVTQAHASHARSRFDIFTECDDDESVRDPDELSSVASTPAATPRPATPRRRRSSRATPRPTPARLSDVCSPDLLAEAAAALGAAGVAAATGATPPSSALRLSSQSSQGTPRARRDCPSPFIVSKRRRLGSGSPRASGSPYSSSPIQPAGCPYDLGDYVKYLDEEAWHVGLVSQVSELSFVIVLDDKSERTLSCVSEETSCRVRPHRAAVGCDPVAPPVLSP